VKQPDLSRLRHFIMALSNVVDTAAGEAEILAAGAPLLASLVSHDDWLPADFAVPDPQRYRQYLLHCDSARRFSVVSFVWGPGQQTPVHNHTVWGMVGMLRGAELSQSYAVETDGLHPIGAPSRLEPGQVETVSPTIGDVHKVSNAMADAVSVSIHVYGADIGAVARATYDEGGGARPFISGYSNAFLPNLWGS